VAGKATDAETEKKRERYLINASIYLHGSEVRTIKSKCSRTDGKVIDIRDEIHGVTSESCKWLLLQAEHGHQLAHIDLDSNALIEKIKPFLLGYKWYFDLLNIIEDAHIEHLFGRNFPGMGQKLRFHNEVMLYYLPRKR